jgi:hypothetical protein
LLHRSTHSLVLPTAQEMLFCFKRCSEHEAEPEQIPLSVS